MHGAADILTHHLDAVAHERRMAHLRWRALVAWMIFAGGLAALVATDVVVGGGTHWLIVLDALVLAGACALWTWLWLAWRGDRWEASSLAHWIEQRMNWSDNRLVIAVELAHASQQSSSMALRDRAIEAGCLAADQLAPEQLIDRHPFKKALRGALAMAGLWLLLGMGTPQLLTTVAARMLDPHGDHPPFTLLQFEVHATPLQPGGDEPVRIETSITGPITPDQAWCVAGDRRLSMRPEGPGRFSIAFDRLEADMRFHVATFGGRSETHQILLRRVPRLTHVWWSSEKAGVPRSLQKNQVIDVIAGLPVRFEAVADRPLRELIWQWQPEGKAISLRRSAVMTTDSRRTLHTQVFKHSGALTLLPVSIEGVKGDQPWTLSIRVSSFSDATSTERIAQRLQAMEALLQQWLEKLSEAKMLDAKQAAEARRMMADLQQQIDALQKQASDAATREAVEAARDRLEAMRGRVARLSGQPGRGADVPEAEGHLGGEPTDLVDAGREIIARSRVDRVAPHAKPGGGGLSVDQLEGVPLRYRDVVEAYLQRAGTESRR